MELPSAEGREMRETSRRHLSEVLEARAEELFESVHRAITRVGMEQSLLEGAVLTETVFAWPGLGLYITHALFNSDMNAVMGGTVLVGTMFIGVNLICDLLYKIFDPRLRT